MVNSAGQTNLFIRLLGWLLRTLFYLLYHQLAWSYDWVAAIVSLGMWKTWVKSVLPYLDEKKILEIGHGPGHLQAALFEKNIQAIGLDASPQMSQQATRRLQKIGCPARLVRGFAQELPFADESFPRIVATFPSEYIADPKTIAELQRVLLPGGKAVVLILAWITGKSGLDKLAAFLFRATRQSPEWEDRFVDPFRESEWIEMKSSRLAIIIAEKDIPNSAKML
jgi:ubiquinone/menaquinone biosynthesis C-methylase UbiE